MRTKFTAVPMLLLALLFTGVVGVVAGPPGPPPPPPEPEPTPPPQPVHPCVLVAPLPPEMDTELERLIPKPPPEPIPWIKAGPLYESGPFKIYINPEFQGINALLNFAQLQRGAYIGLLQAAAPFRFEYRGGDRCPRPPVGAARSLDDGSYLIWMANAPVLGIKPPPEMIPLNWFIVVVRLTSDGKIDMKDIAIAYYPDAQYRSPETMLKAARSLDDGGILMPLPPKTQL